MLLRPTSSRNNMMVDHGAPVNDVQRSPSLHDDEDFSTIHSASEDDAASSKYPGSTSRGSSTGQQSDDPESMYFGQTVSRHVRGLKLMVFGILFLVTVAVCCAVYLVTDRGQYDEFQAAFEGDAIKVVKSFEDILLQKIAALAAFSVTVTSYALQSGSPWPFVTMNNFAERAASVKSLSKVLTVQVIPKVDGENLGLWNNYSFANKEWVDEMRQHQQDQKIPYELNQYDGPPTQIVPFIYNREGAASGEGPFYPFWQQTPLFPAPLDLVNFDILASLGPGPRSNFDIAANTNQVAIGGMLTAPPGDLSSNNTQTRYYSQWISFDEKTQTNYTGEPLSTVFLPIMESFEADSKPAAVLVTVLQWGRYFEDILSPMALPLDIVLSNTCDEDIHTFSIRGVNVEYRGSGNRASTRFEDIAETAFVDENGFVIEEDTIQLTLNQDVCRYTLKVYPTEEHFNHYNDNFPVIITSTVAAVFLFTVAVIIAYDIMIEKRQRQVLDTAKRSTAIVSSIFPKSVRDKLMSAPVQGNATKLRTLAQQGNTSSMDISDIGKGGPIADLFPECTVMFADIEGFTAWSSVREPSQVFTLLETLYAAMDATATRRRVFKVETVGDCYVAVCGLPEPKADHAVTMARFARDCIEQHISIVTGKLERALGPETGELRLRVGIHSGPITAGVLRGKGSRFQLFGDTVNTCARLESSSDGNRIHTSEITANLLIAGGYPDWITARPGVVNLKGKGAMKTFWVEPVSKKDKFSSVRKSTESFNLDASLVEQAGDPTSTKKARLITWNVDILMRSLSQIIARRDSFANLQAPAWQARGLMPLEEVVEVIELPSKAASPSLRRDPNSVTIDPTIRQLVHDYVSCLADLYHDNPFHNFEHASHVTMSVAKLLSRIVAPSDMDFRDSNQAEAQLHDHTYGITSDPLTQFSCILSALIHDVDHQGVSNTTLVAEKDALTRIYGEKSVAEQNSVDQAWDLLMTEHFRPLLALLCRDEAELAHFRQLVVNGVLATDIMDADLKKRRNARWDKAFKLGNDEEGGEAINRKATIVIEHLIQASDVAHTMQHWNIYTKWNGRLFKEMYKAFVDGREGAKDPSAFWAKGEIGFFDFYIIPLTKKLKECGVFGASSDEYLNYAISNRKEWEMKGEMIVQSLIEEVHKEYGKPSK